MRILIRFDTDELLHEVTDEEFAEYERRNAHIIETRRIMRGLDEAQALNHARRDEREKLQIVIDEQAARIAELEAQLGKK